MVAEQLPTLDGERVRLRWVTSADLPALYAVFSHPEVMRYWGWPAMRDLKEAQALLDSIHEHFQRADLFQWGIELKAQPGLIGTCTLASIDRRHRRAEVGYALARPHWGQGLMSEALDVLFTHAFSSLNLHRIEADVDPRNTASIELLLRKGFQREGYLRERWQVAGEVCDGAFFGLLAPQYCPSRRALRAGGDSAQ